MKIAIVGSGIAGNVAAWHLHREHDITVFEAGAHIGGHTHTHTVEDARGPLEIDTGFIVFNDWTYPNFIRLLDELGVASQPSSMSFSVRNEASGREWCGSGLNALFAQRRNLFRPAFHRMIRDILRFNREAPQLLDGADERPLGEFLAAHDYSAAFRDDYLVPMGAAIWSTDPRRMLEMPARYFVRFFHNHGMLSIDERPQWRVVRGGSARYVERLTQPFHDCIRLEAPVEWIRRTERDVLLKSRGAGVETFDAVFVACHSDQALRLLADSTLAEREVLGAIAYQANETVLHTDTRLLPRARRAWAAWNYHVRAGGEGPVAVTYDMNVLQSLNAAETYCVTLNHSEAIDPRRIVKRLTYHHPLYTPAAVAAQARQRELNGARRTYFCGAYWRFGFHEDGVVSALDALEHFRETTREERALRRVA